jgi:hypothetical protein
MCAVPAHSMTDSRPSTAAAHIGARRLAWPSTDTLAAFDVFVVLGLFGIYLKLALLAPQWGAVARFLGRQPGEPLPVWDRIGFFASDLTLNLIVLPLVGTALVTLLFRSWRVVAACVVAACLSLVYFIELRASVEVGQYLSGEMVRDFLGWSFANPSLAHSYATPASLVKLAVFVAAIASFVVIAPALRRAPPGPWRTASRLALAAPMAVALLLVTIVLPAAYARRHPHSTLNVSAVARAATTLLAPVDARAASPWGSVDDALGALRTLTRTAPFDRAHGLVGREAGSDLLVFMMETAPAQALDFASAPPDLPGLRRLQPRSLVSSQHYTAHPYSSDALFAVLAGTYPHGRRQLLADLGSRHVNGLFSSLPPAIDHRAVYLPSLYQIELDDTMYGAFGARTLYAADRHPDDPLAGYAATRAEAIVRRFETARPLEPGARSLLRDKLAADLQALERLKADLRATIAAGRHYGVMFFPEIGHGPWPQLRDGDGDVLARGRLLMTLQDEWLNELLDVIAAGGRLDRTVVAVTADHGLRTRAEYPRLRVGFLSDVMFRVPLLIHAPQALRAPVVLAAPSSHIDLAPTLLALLGSPDAVARMHGVPIWQRTPRDRLYLLGASYGGADGYLENGRFYMHQALSGAVYASGSFAFTDAHQLPPGHPAARAVESALIEASEGQHALTARLRAP